MKFKDLSGSLHNYDRGQLNGAACTFLLIDAAEGEHQTLEPLIEQAAEDLKRQIRNLTQHHVFAPNNDDLYVMAKIIVLCNEGYIPEPRNA